MPRFVKVSATAFSKDESDKLVYQDKVIDFEMQLISEITVESAFKRGVELCKTHRT